MSSKNAAPLQEPTALSQKDVTYVQKACAYITRNERELLVFEGPGHDGLQIPKGTIEGGEDPGVAVVREVAEESGLDVAGTTTHLTTDVWTRRHSPPKRYVRHFFHTDIEESRDHWTHTVTGEGEEVGMEFEYSWVELPSSREFALALDDYVHLLGPTPSSDDWDRPLTALCSVSFSTQRGSAVVAEGSLGNVSRTDEQSADTECRRRR